MRFPYRGAFAGECGILSRKWPFEWSGSKALRRPEAAVQAERGEGRDSGPMKIFRCGLECEVDGRTDGGPRWKISQGGSRGDLAVTYGKSGTGLLAVAAERRVSIRFRTTFLRSIGGVRSRRRVFGDAALAPFWPWRTTGARHPCFRNEEVIRTGVGGMAGAVIMQGPFGAERGSRGVHHSGRSRRSALPRRTQSTAP